MSADNAKDVVSSGGNLYLFRVLLVKGDKETNPVLPVGVAIRPLKIFRVVGSGGNGGVCGVYGAVVIYPKALDREESEPFPIMNAVLLSLPDSLLCMVDSLQKCPIAV